MKAPRPSSKANQLEPRFDQDGVQATSGLDPDGRELPDPVPMAPPIGYEAPATLEQIIARLVRREDFNRYQDSRGLETFEEADDFDVEDEDYDPRFPETIYEAYFDAKSKRRADVEARRQSISQTASEGLVSPLTAETTAEKPKLDVEKNVVGDTLGKTGDPKASLE